MPTDLLARLEQWKSRFGAGKTEKLHRLLRAAMGSEFRDPGEVIRWHECLLFLRAYPADGEVVRLANRALSSFARRTAGLAEQAAFEDPTVSGIAGTSFSAVFSYDVARSLAARYPRRIEIDWENYDQLDRFGPVLRRLLPLVEEDWPVEAHVPFRRWIDAARGRRQSSLAWLLNGMARLPLSARERSDLYDSLELLLVWRIGNSSDSRTHMRLPERHPFYHTTPLIARREISLAAELEAAPLPVTRLAGPEGRRILGRILGNSAMRYRELYGFTHPDAVRVFRADAGRGVQIVFFGVPPEWRLPVRAYHAGVFFKNGVPAGYVEVLSLSERAEVGFNLYYTFREGESAWIYARLLRLFRQVLGVTCFSVDPYQVGWENDEAIDSGAFWFYRKLGFRPLDPQVARLVAREESRLRRAPGYRSSRAILTKLARSYMLYDGAGSGSHDWDEFRVRNLALRCTAMGADRDVLRQIAKGWNREERIAMEAIVRAKNGPDERRYLRLMQRHRRLRETLIRLGS